MHFPLPYWEGGTSQDRNQFTNQWDPWDERYIYLHEWLIFMVKVGKYTFKVYPPPRIPVTNEGLGWETKRKNEKILVVTVSGLGGSCKIYQCHGSYGPWISFHDLISQFSPLFSPASSVKISRRLRLPTCASHRLQTRGIPTRPRHFQRNLPNLSGMT